MNLGKLPLVVLLLGIARVAVAQDNDCPQRLVEEGKLRLLEHSNATALAFSPDSLLVATVSHNRITLWETENGKSRWSLLEEHGWPNVDDACHASVAFAPSGETIVWTQGNGVLHVTDVKSGKTTYSLREPWFVTRDLPPYARLNPPSGTGGIQGVSKDQKMIAGRVPLQSIAISPDGEFIACGANDASIQLWELKTRKHSKELGASHGAVREKTDSETKLRRLGYIADKDPGAKDYPSGQAGEKPTVELWHVPRARFLTYLAYFSDGKTILSHDGQSAAMWDVATNRRVFRSEPCDAVAWSADGESLAITRYGKGIRLIEWSKGPDSRPLVSSVGYFKPLLWSPDKSTIIAGRPGAAVRAWDATSGELKETLYERPDVASPTAMAISANGRYLAACWNEAWRVGLIDLRSGR